jgi:hypothetical protein
MGTFDSRPISLGELVRTLISHPYHGHKDKQETGFALEVSNRCGKQVSDSAKCENDLAFVELGTFRIEAACELANPDDREDLQVEIQFLAEANLAP